jgi:hypothetical protein
MSKKMQQLLDLIVNEETEKANELFHEIVVEMSRGIYENLIAEEEEEEMDEASEEDDEEMDESAEDNEDYEEMDESFGDDSDPIGGGDPADDMMDKVDADHDDSDDEFGMDDEPEDDFGGEEHGGAPATKDDVQDLEDALAELKAEFEALMGGEGGEDDGMAEPEDDAGENPFGDEDGDESDEDSEDDEESDEDDEEDDEEMESMGLREYRETVGNDWDKNSQKSEGPMVGTGHGIAASGGKNTKSPVNTNAKSTMPNSKANAKNIAQGDVGEGAMDGNGTNADKGKRGLVGNTQGEFTKGVQKNIANSANAKMKSGAALDSVKKGHGAERKGTSPEPVGSGRGDKAGQTSDAQGAKKPFLQPYKK